MKYAKRWSGFTILELLIVLVTIIIIAGLLLPALLGARDSTLLANCLSNMKQIGIGWVAYTTDNRGCLPGYRLSDTDPADWWERIGPYENKVGGNTVTHGTNKYHVNYISGIFVCPADQTNHPNIDPDYKTNIDYGAAYHGKRFGANDRGSYVYNKTVRPDDDTKYLRMLRNLPVEDGKAPILAEGKVKDQDCGFDVDIWTGNNNDKVFFPNYHNKEKTTVMFATAKAQVLDKAKAQDLINKYGDLKP